MAEGKGWLPYLASLEGRIKKKKKQSRPQPSGPDRLLIRGRLAGGLG